MTKAFLSLNLKDIVGSLHTTSSSPHLEWNCTLHQVVAFSTGFLIFCVVFGAYVPGWLLHIVYAHTAPPLLLRRVLKSVDV